MTYITFKIPIDEVNVGHNLSGIFIKALGFL